MVEHETIRITRPCLSRRRWVLALFGFVVLFAASSLAARAAERHDGILVTEIRGAIGGAGTRLMGGVPRRAPGGARAASAGTFIVYAAHLAAMAPGTNVGAATPIELGGLPGLPRPTEPKRDEKDKAAPPTETAAQRKALNDTIAMLRSLAQLRGRNIEWAEKAVRDAATLTAEDALKEGVIDIVARDLDDLL